VVSAGIVFVTPVFVALVCVALLVVVILLTVFVVVDACVEVFCDAEPEPCETLVTTRGPEPPPVTWSADV
jgi:hypothetical protein